MKEGHVRSSLISFVLINVIVATINAMALLIDPIIGLLVAFPIGSFTLMFILNKLKFHWLSLLLSALLISAATWFILSLACEFIPASVCDRYLPAISVFPSIGLMAGVIYILIMHILKWTSTKFRQMR